MKKLMIAAASAAMISGGYAGIVSPSADVFVGSPDVVYDVTLSLKTTKGVSASKGAKVTLNLGENALGQFWYDAVEQTGEAFTNYWQAVMTTKRVGGKTIPAIDKRAVQALGLEIDFGEALAPVATAYNRRSAGKWCDTYSYTPDGLCYRSASSLKLQGLYRQECCNDGSFLQDQLLYRFGSMTSARATKVEYVGDISFNIAGGHLFDQNLRETNYFLVDDANTFGASGAFAAAGQGTFGRVTVNGGAGNRYSTDIIKTLSGSVAGMLDNTDCEFCCASAVPAVCFDVCTNTMFDDNNPPVGTAAYGTFTVKVNQTETNRYAAQDLRSVAFANGL